MNNLPIIASAPQAAAKPVQAAAPAEDNAAPAKPFGEVLARQVSDAKKETSPPPKKEAAKAAAEKPADNKAEDAATGDAAANLPAEMLATLLPQGLVVAAQADSPATTGEVALDAADAHAQIAAPEATGLPNQIAVLEVAAQPKQTATSSVSAKTGPDLGLGAAGPVKNGAAATTKNGAAAIREPFVEAKKDTAFTSMMATMNAAMADKFSNADEKAGALAANPQPNAASLATMQTTALLAPAIAMPTVVNINTPVTHDKWGDEFNQKITWLAGTKEQSAELHLNPPQLGPMDVVLKVSGDQATAMFSSPHAAVREAIEQALPKLREMMADNGIMLGNATVSDQSPRNQQNDSEDKQSASRSGISAVSDTGGAGIQSVRVSPISRHNGIVDTFA